MHDIDGLTCCFTDGDCFGACLRLCLRRGVVPLTCRRVRLNVDVDKRSLHTVIVSLSRLTSHCALYVQTRARLRRDNGTNWLRIATAGMSGAPLSASARARRECRPFVQTSAGACTCTACTCMHLRHASGQRHGVGLPGRRRLRRKGFCPWLRTDQARASRARKRQI